MQIKKFVITLKKNSFHFFNSLVEFQILDCFCYSSDSDNCLEQIFYLQTLLKTKKIYRYIKEKKFNKYFRSSQCGSYLMTILLIQEVRVVFVI